MGSAASIDRDAIAGAADALFAPDAAHGSSLALVVQVDGDVVFERYGTQPDTPFGPGEPVDAGTTLISWSMAKSITHALVGLLVADGALELDAPAPVHEWHGTEKAAISVQHLLNMSSGLEFVEDYVDAGISHCIEMLFGSGRDDMAAYAAALPLVHAPGSHWNYSSGTTNIVASIAGDIVAHLAGVRRSDAAGRSEAMLAFLSERLFGPLGMESATPKFDAAGTFVGSSFVYATARDFAAFGELYRMRGRAPDGRAVLPETWIDHARRQAAVDPESGFGYGAHWWLWPDLPGAVAAHGYEGQYTLVEPARGLVAVHLGKVPAEHREVVVDGLRTIAAAVSPASGGR
ncbi:MAG: serine hydrolase domain-containing protein [Ilumatobacteraceae bacterium]